MKTKLKSLVFFLIIFKFIFLNASADNIDEIIINGNERIPEQTILMFANIDNKSDLDLNSIDEILKNLYNSNFFENVIVKLEKNTLIISVKEFPIIEKISIEGIKAKKIRDEINENLTLKSRSSFNEIELSENKNTILKILRERGYYFANVEIYTEEIESNKINIKYEIDIGDKAKIKKITFLGNKVFKDGKLKTIIISEEYKFWKFISGKKYLNENLIVFDEKLLTNFYLNKGYYNVKVNSSIAKLINKNEFELIYNIDSGEKIYFDKINLTLPNDFNQENFNDLNIYFNKLKGERYSINIVEEVLNRIDEITLNEELKSISASVEENVNENKINLNFVINEIDKFFVEKINILGNNVTRENVIRNQLEIDEGDPYNEILEKKSENNIKSLNFFKNVETEVLNGTSDNLKIINISVEEKPTGEISAGAGFGTNGATMTFGIRENNYLGKGLSVDSNLTINAESFKGKLGISNPNYGDGNKTIFANIQATEIDRVKDFGYKSNKTGIELGTSFEYLKKLNLGISNRSFYEKIETDASASATQKSQEGNYFDSFLKFNFDYDKRNQRFRTTDGFRSFYSIDLPLISETNTFTNLYNYKVFSELYENNVSALSFYLKSSNSITGDDIKLSERLYIPSSRLRGFEAGKIGPKDGADFIGGNYIASLNATTSLPFLFENAQNIDFILFFDAANVWGIDYNTSLDDSNVIRSSVGLAVDWFTVIGPLNFSLTETLSQANTDITESFRFNIGTTF